MNRRHPVGGDRGTQGLGYQSPWVLVHMCARLFCWLSVGDWVAAESTASLGWLTCNFNITLYRKSACAQGQCMGKTGHTHTQICAYIQIHICTELHSHTHICKHTPDTCIHVYTYAHIHTSTYTHLYIDAHIYIHTYIQNLYIPKCIHIYTHIYLHAPIYNWYKHRYSSSHLSIHTHAFAYKH